MVTDILFIDRVVNYSVRVYSALEKIMLELENDYQITFIGPNDSKTNNVMKKYFKNFQSVWIKNHFIRKIFEYQKEKKAKIVHIAFEIKTFGDFRTVFKLPILLILLKITKAKIVFSFHTMFVHKENDNWEISQYFFKALPKPILKILTKVFTKIICNLSDKIIIETEIGKKALVEYFGIQKEKIKVIQLGIAPYQAKTKFDNNKLKNIPKNKKIILYFGVISPRKTQDMVIRAFSRICEELSDYILVIAGSAPKEYQAYEKGLKKLVQKLDLNEKVIFTGFVDDDKVDQLFCISDFTLFIYQPMSSGTYALTYSIFHNKPCIVSNIETFHEILNGKGALVVEPNDEIDLADSMVELANNRTLYKKLQSEENEIGKKFTWEIAAKKHIEVFREIIDST